MDSTILENITSQIKTIPDYPKPGIMFRDVTSLMQNPEAFAQVIDLFKQNRAVTYVLTFILPLLGAIFAADKFLAVLSYAGLIMVFIAVFIPMMMALNLRKADGKTQTAISNDAYYEVGGGQIAMMVCFGFGLFLIGAQVI